MLCKQKVPREWEAREITSVPTTAITKPIQLHFPLSQLLQK